MSAMPGILPFDKSLFCWILPDSTIDLKLTAYS